MERVVNDAELMEDLNRMHGQLSLFNDGYNQCKRKRSLPHRSKMSKDDLYETYNNSKYEVNDSPTPTLWRDKEIVVKEKNAFINTYNEISFYFYSDDNGKTFTAGEAYYENDIERFYPVLDYIWKYEEVNRGAEYLKYLKIYKKCEADTSEAIPVHEFRTATWLNESTKFIANPLGVNLPKSVLNEPTA